MKVESMKRYIFQEEHGLVKIYQILVLIIQQEENLK